MEIYRKIKSLAITAWRDLNNKNLTNEEVEKDIQTFFKWLNYLVNIIISVYILFSLVSIYFFTTRVIL